MLCRRPLCHTPLKKVPDSAIKEVGLKLTDDGAGKAFLDPNKDRSAGAARIKA